MDAFEAIYTRRSIRYFDSTHQMSDAEVETLLKAAITSPTSFNLQNWRFVVVKDPTLRQEIRHAALDQAKVTEASLLLVLCGDQQAWAKAPARYWSHAPKEVQDTMVALIDGFYRDSGHVQMRGVHMQVSSDRAQVRRDEVMRSCGIAAQSLMLVAKAVGYDSCAMIGFDADVVANLINLPNDHVIAMMLTIGKQVRPPHNRGAQLTLEDVVVIDHF
ncbi:MAG: nitroreductase family protein [bacterium]|nr:nitroreductase family protein [bacterium]